MYTGSRCAVALVVAISMGGCAVVPRGGDVYGGVPGTTPYPAAPAMSAYGTVIAIEVTRATRSVASAGAVLGGAIGALIGRQIGTRNSDSQQERDVATAIGAILGAAAGHQLDKRQRDGTVRVTVRFDRGGHVTIEQHDVGDLRIGDRVRVDRGGLVRFA